MNERVFGLSEEKRFRIINAGFEVFAQNEHKRASTDEIGRRGGISKGLLFYYFHNKKAFYLFLFDSAFEQLTRYASIPALYDELEAAGFKTLYLLGWEEGGFARIWPDFHPDEGRLGGVAKLREGIEGGRSRRACNSGIAVRS